MFFAFRLPATTQKSAESYVFITTNSSTLLQNIALKARIFIHNDILHIVLITPSIPNSFFFLPRKSTSSKFQC